ncbi:MAG: ATP-dependent DNA helicase [Deltaproteobacteria bacterium]|jgi:ATP-dependent DNA helicase DinG|nr:ATP-dependent DNA helicase [Deltaproteobacteria bacterium]
MNPSERQSPSGRIPLPGSFPSDIGDLDYILKKDGALALRWPDFQPRGSQLRMFRETARAFRDGDISIIEAGTGTGKTLAYLLPAIISGKTTLVSTGLRNLQEQIFNKDLGFIREHFDSGFTAAILKGRDNYLCLRRFTDVMGKRRSLMAMADRELKRKFRLLGGWVTETRSGEVAEISYALGKDPPFDRLGSSSEYCLGKKCGHHGRCFLMKARELAAQANLILVNHHLFMADLTLREASSAVLPEWEAVVFDEAHLLEGTAVRYFSKEFSTAELTNACYDFSRLLDRLMEGRGRQEGPGSEWAKGILELREAAENHQETAARITTNLQGTGRERELWPPGPPEKWPERDRGLRDTLARLAADLGRLVKSAESQKGPEDDEFTPALRTILSLAQSAAFIARNDNPKYVYTVKPRKNEDVTLAAVPLQVSDYLRESLFSFRKTVVLTSATMSAEGSLTYFNRSLGIPEQVKGLILDSPFDFWNRTTLYLPKHMPEPKYETGYDDFSQALVRELPVLLGLTRGRALVLFTSNFLLDKVHEAVEGRLPFRVLKQGDASRTKLLDDFRHDVGSVLMATASFWQGVDVPGEGLTAVIIDKLPFPVQDPLNEAKKRRLVEANKAWFPEFYLPEMEIKLKQGLGRLIRSKDDWGLMAILDPRLNIKNYGRSVLKTFPHGPIIYTHEEVRRFMARMEGAGREPARLS